MKQGEGELELELGEMRVIPQTRQRRGEEEGSEGGKRQEITKEGEMG